MLTYSDFFTNFASDFASDIQYRFFKDSDVLKLEVDLPGANKEDVNMELENRTLKINAKRMLGGKEHSYTQKFSLPYYLSTDSVDASLENGVLTLSFSKDEEHIKKIELT